MIQSLDEKLVRRTSLIINVIMGTVLMIPFVILVLRSLTEDSSGNAGTFFAPSGEYQFILQRDDSDTPTEAHTLIVYPGYSARRPYRKYAR